LCSAILGHNEKVQGMYFFQNEKIGVFIDGQHLYNVSRGLGFDVDYRDLLKFFREQGRLVHAYYYAALLENEEYTPLRPLMDWLDYNGYLVVSKSAREYTDANGNRRVQSNMDVDIATDMLEQANHLDHFVLVSGSGNLRRPIEALRAKGARTSVMTSVKTAPPMCSDDLRRACDEFIEINEVMEHFTRRRTEPRTDDVRTIRRRPAPAVAPGIVGVGD